MLSYFKGDKKVKFVKIQSFTKKKKLSYIIPKLILNHNSDTLNTTFNILKLSNICSTLFLYSFEHVSQQKLNSFEQNVKS